MNGKVYKPLLLYDLSFWRSQGLQRELKQLEELYKLLFEFVPTQAKVYALQTEVLGHITDRLKFIANDDPEMIPMQALKDCIDAFNTQLAPLRDPPFKRRQLVSCNTKVPIDNHRNFFSPEVTDRVRVWVCMKTNRIVRWTMLCMSEPTTEFESINFQTMKKETRVLESHNVKVLRLEPATTHYERPCYMRRKSLIVIENGDMFLLSGYQNVLHLTNGVPIIYIGFVNIDLDGNLLEILADSRVYPVTDAHTKMIIQHLKNLGLDTSKTNIRSIAPFVANRPTGAQSAVTQPQAPTLQAQASPRQAIAQPAIPNLPIDAISSIPHESNSVRASDNPDDYAEYLDKIKLWCVQNVAESDAHFEFITFLSQSIDAFKSLEQDPYQMTSFIAAIDLQIKFFKDNANLSDQSTQEFAALLSIAPWSMVPMINGRFTPRNRSYDTSLVALGFRDDEASEDIAYSALSSAPPTPTTRENRIK